MDISRRNFLRMGATGLAGVVAGNSYGKTEEGYFQIGEYKIERGALLVLDEMMGIRRIIYPHERTSVKGLMLTLDLNNDKTITEMEAMAGEAVLINGLNSDQRNLVQKTLNKGIPRVSIGNLPGFSKATSQK